MADAPRYWSPEFIEAFAETLNDDPAFQRAAGSFTNTIELRCLDTPDGQDVAATYTFESGVLTDVDVWIEDAPSEELRDEPFDRDRLMARATATYRTWTRLDRGEIGVLQALTLPDYKIEGPKLKIMTNMSVFNGMNDVAARIDKTY